MPIPKLKIYLKTYLAQMYHIFVFNAIVIKNFMDEIVTGLNLNMKLNNMLRILVEKF